MGSFFLNSAILLTNQGIFPTEVFAFEITIYTDAGLIGNSLTFFF